MIRFPVSSITSSISPRTTVHASRASGASSAAFHPDGCASSMASWRRFARTARALIVPAAVARDRVQPGRELRVESKGVEAGVRLDEDVLRQIGRAMPVGGEPVTPRDNLRVMTPDQLVDRLT